MSIDRKGSERLTLTGRGDGAVVPLQVGGGERGEGVQRKAVGARQTLLEVQQVMWFVVLGHVRCHIQIRHVLNQWEATGGVTDVALSSQTTYFSSDG